MTDQYGTPLGDGQPPYGQPQGGQQYGAPQYAPPGWGAPYPAPQNASDAVIALVASIVSWVVCPIVPAIVALVYASRAQQAIAASGGALTGQSMVTAARLIAWIHLALVVVFVTVLVALVVGLSVVRS